MNTRTTHAHYKILFFSVWTLKGGPLNKLYTPVIRDICSHSRSLTNVFYIAKNGATQGLGVCLHLVYFYT